MTTPDSILAERESKINSIDYFLIFFLIACSGFPTFIFTLNYSLTILFVCLAVYFIYRKQKVDKYFWRTIAVLTAINAAQYIEFEYISLESVMSLFIIFLTAYFVVKIYRAKFILIYIKIMTAVTIVSFFFYALVLFFPSVTDFLINNVSPLFQVETGTFFRHSPNIIIYNFNFDLQESGLLRNSGPFWEPGAFGGFLIVALIFNYFVEKKLFSRNSLILMAGVVTTFSTTSYIALSILLFFYLTIRTSVLAKVVFLPLFLGMVLFLYGEIPFLGEKIYLQYSSLSTSSVDYQQRTRFVSAVLDLYDFTEYPVWGRGKSDATRFTGYASYAGELKHRNNGVTDFLAQYGGVGFIIFFGYILFSFSRLSKYFLSDKYYALIFLIIILSIGFSEKYFNRPLFVCLPFLFMIFYESTKNARTKDLYLHTCP